MYKLVLHGSKDASPTGLTALKIRLAQKLGMPGAAIDGIFSELPYTLKDNLTENQANTLKSIIDELGSVTEIEEVPDLDLTLSPTPDPVEELETWHQSALDSPEHEVNYDLTLQPDSDTPSMLEGAADDLDDLTGELESLIGELSDASSDSTEDLSSESLNPDAEPSSELSFAEEESDELILTEPEDSTELSFSDTNEDANELSFAEKEPEIETNSLSFATEATPVEKPSSEGVSSEEATNQELSTGLSFSEEEVSETKNVEEAEDKSPESNEVEETGYVNLTPEEEQQIVSKAFSKDSSPVETEAPAKTEIESAELPVVKASKPKAAFLIPVLAIIAAIALILAPESEDKSVKARPKIQLDRLDRILGSTPSKAKTKTPKLETVKYAATGETEGVFYDIELEATDENVITTAKLKISSSESPKLSKEDIVSGLERTPWLVELNAEGDVTTDEAGNYLLTGKAWLTDGERRGRVIPKVFIKLDSAITVTAHYMPNKELPTENYFGKGSNNLYEFFLSFNADTKSQD